jgi:hypothetical protein
VSGTGEMSTEHFDVGYEFTQVLENSHTYL